MMVRELEFSNWGNLGHVTTLGAGYYGVTPTWSEWDYQDWLNQSCSVLLVETLWIFFKKKFHVYKKLVNYWIPIILIKINKDLILLAMWHNWRYLECGVGRLGLDFWLFHLLTFCFCAEAWASDSLPDKWPKNKIC